MHIFLSIFMDRNIQQAEGQVHGVLQGKKVQEELRIGEQDEGKGWKRNNYGGSVSFIFINCFRMCSSITEASGYINPL